MTMVTISLPHGETAEAYLARPADADEHPGLLLLMDAIGLRPQIASMSERISSWGYVVLAPNVYHQYGTAAETSPTGPLVTKEEREAFFAGGRPRREGLFSAENRGHLLEDLRGYVDALHAQPGVSGGPVGVSGYCMGVRLAMLVAGEVEDGVAAVGGFHGGGLITDDPLSPHRAIATATAEFWFGHAETDGSNTPDQQRALSVAMDDAGLVHGAEQYEGAPHGYTMADTANYHEPSAEQHYRDLRSLLDRALA